MKVVIFWIAASWLKNNKGNENYYSNGIINSMIVIWCLEIICTMSWLQDFPPQFENTNCIPTIFPLEPYFHTAQLWNKYIFLDIKFNGILLHISSLTKFTRVCTPLWHVTYKSPYLMQQGHAWETSKIPS